MSKAIKTIAPIAIAAAGMYYGMNTPGGFGGIFDKKGSAVSKNPFGAFGLVMSGASAIQQQKYSKSQANFQRDATRQQNQAEEKKNRYNQLLARRQRLTAIREARIRQGQIEGNTAGNQLGAGGTSSFVGAIGSVGTAAAANQGNLNVAEDVGNQISDLNRGAARSMSEANTMASKSNMWSSVNTLGGTLLDASSIFFPNFPNSTSTSTKPTAGMNYNK